MATSSPTGQATDDAPASGSREITLSLLTGVRTEEARALRWSHVVACVEKAKDWRPVSEADCDHQKYAVYVWRSVGEGGDAVTEKSRRTLEIPDQAAEALRQHHTRQAAHRLKAGDRWQGDLVFSTRAGTELAVGNVLRSFRAITKAAGIGDNSTPRELWHSFG